jgi:D-ribose pyranose/furanose isomerase RbsD
MERKEQKVVILHGFDKPEILKVMKLLKENFQGEDLIFASTTPTSLTWRVEDLINELKQEHEEFKKMRQIKQQEGKQGE